MKTTINYSKFWLTIGLIVAAVIFRIIPHPLNMTPLIAISLLAGAKFENKIFAFIIPIIALLLSDIVVAYTNNYPFLHDTVFFTYGSVLLIVLLGTLLKGKSFNAGKTAAISLTSSILFFIISNFGVWLFSNMYSLDINGLVKCYVLAIPFNKFSWIGDLVFTFTLFGLYEIVMNKFIAPKAQSVYRNGK